MAVNVDAPVMAIFMILLVIVTLLALRRKKSEEEVKDEMDKLDDPEPDEEY